jgi:hypothetical protein
MLPGLQLVGRFCLGLCLLTGTAQAEPPLPGEGAPTSIEEVGTFYQARGSSPDAVLALWFSGVLMYGNPEVRPLATHLLAQTTADFDGDLSWVKRPSAKTFVDRLADPAFAHVFRSYFKTTSPENGYRMVPDSMELNIEHSGPDPRAKGELADRQWVIRLRSSGADSARAVYLLKHPQTGRWQVTRFSSVYVDIRKPKVP